ncbi:MAG: ATP-binding protein [Rhodanobacteraceae bacterium]
MSTRPILVSWSGGKDCLMALQRLRDDPAWNVVALLTTVNREHDRIAMHGIRRSVLEAQAEALNLPVIVAEMDWPGRNEAYLESWRLALAQARQRWPRLDQCAFGDIHLADVRAWREQQMTACGWGSVFPLWHEDSRQLAQHFVDAGHRARLVCVDTEQLDAAFCGRPFDDALLAALPGHVDQCGENGEFHTLAHGGPLFATPLELASGESVLRDGRFQFQDFLLDDG